MPARTEKLYVFATDQPNRVLRFPLWWDRRDFFEKFVGRGVDTGHPLYVDYAYLLTPGEALAFDKQSREAYIADPNRKLQHVAAEMDEFAPALKGARWVVVESTEWESGLD